MTFILDVLANFASNIVFWIALGLTFAAAIRTTQSRFRQFFGIEDTRSLYVCLSNLWHPDSPQRHSTDYNRYYIGLNELEAARAVDALFGTATFRLPDAARGLIDAIWARSARRTLNTVSPCLSDSVDSYGQLDQSLIVVGASRWNLIRRHYVDRDVLKLRFSTECDSELDNLPFQVPLYVQVYHAPGAGDRIETDLSLAIVEKVRNLNSEGSVFFCAGSRGNISRAAVQYLVRHWRKLERDFGTGDFALCLGFPSASGRGERYSEPTLLRRIP
jgi:hypothetical protein